MEEESATLNNTNDTCLNLFPAPRSRNDTLHEPFLNFDENSDLSFEDKSTIHNSLVALVKAEYPFDKALQDRAVQFLKSLEPEDDVRGQSTAAVKLVTELVPSSAGSPSGFIPSIVTLLSSPHSTVVAAALSFLNESSRRSSHAGVCYLVESGLVVKVLATVQPHTLPITGNETILDNLNWIIRKCVSLVIPSSLNLLGITTPVEKYNHREMIFQMVVLPSSQFVTFLISNRYVLFGNLFRSFMSLLSKHLRIGPFHRPTLEFVVASPIAMAFSCCLSFVEECRDLWMTLINIHHSLREWKKESP